MSAIVGLQCHSYINQAQALCLNRRIRVGGGGVPTLWSALLPVRDIVLRVANVIKGGLFYPLQFIVVQ